MNAMAASTRRTKTVEAQVRELDVARQALIDEVEKLRSENVALKTAATEIKRATVLESEAKLEQFEKNMKAKNAAAANTIKTEYDNKINALERSLEEARKSNSVQKQGLAKLEKEITELKEMEKVKGKTNQALKAQLARESSEFATLKKRMAANVASEKAMTDAGTIQSSLKEESANKKSPPQSAQYQYTEKARVETKVSKSKSMKAAPRKAARTLKATRSTKRSH